jgi:hypothetical protein
LLHYADTQIAFHLLDYAALASVML